MANKMLIDATHPEETRVVVLRGNRVEEFDFESAQRKQLRGNIYLAKVTRVEPSLQAAFVDYGGNRHGFLAFSEIHPDYYQIPVADRQALIDEEGRAQRAADDEVDRRSRRHRRHPRQSAARHDDVMRGEISESPASDPATASDAPGTPGEADAATAALPMHDDNRSEQLSGASDPHPDSQPGDAEAPAAQREALGSSDHITERLPWENTARDGESEEPFAAEHFAGESVADETVADADFSGQPGTTADAGHEAGTDQGAEPMEHGGAFADHAFSGDSFSDDADTEHTGEHPHHDDNATEDHGDSADNGDADEAAEEMVESVGGADALEEVPDRAPRYRRQYKIQEVIKRRQVMLVQVVKEERGTKGAALTTYLSLAGRYSVLMPNTARGGGISRKITSAEDRSRLKEIAQELEVPEGMGVILRTAGASRTKTEVKRDFEYLLRLWETVRDLTLKSTAPKLVYEEGSLVKRSIRDLYSKDIDEITVAGPEAYHEAKDFMRMLMPSHAKNVRQYAETQPLLSRYGVESQLDAMFSPIVQLRSGGYIVINQAEALVAIDVNSGRATREHHIEDTALKTNLEASDEIARQLRLRDLAGLIVIDYIDMDENRNNRAVERRLKECLKQDRARIQVGRISHFGLLEMSRQRIRTSVLESSTEKCPYCGGTGHVRSVSSLALQVLRALEEQMMRGATHNLIARTRPDVALYVLNQKRAHLRALEERFSITITVSADESVTAPQAFVIDRGEQVHTAEAARAIADKSQAIPTALEEEDDLEDSVTVEDDSVADLAEESAGSAAAASTPEEREGGRRRRRRRRRGRDDAEHPVNGDAPHEQGAEHAADSLSEADEDAPAHDAGAEPDGDQAPTGRSERDDKDEPHRDGERRRRRRGRRGGRRNRHERDGEPTHASNGDAQQSNQELAPVEDLAEAPAIEPELTTAVADLDAPQSAPRHEPADMTATDTTATDLRRSETPEMQATQSSAPLPASSPPRAPADAEPPRRRSTVREPAPTADNVGAPPPVQPATSAPEPQPEPAATEASEGENANRPRRTGWWSRRFG